MERGQWPAHAYAQVEASAVAQKTRAADRGGLHGIARTCVTGLHIERTPMRFTSTTRKVYAAGIAFAIALAVLRMYGLTVADLARIARAKFIESTADAKAVTSREYSDRV